MLPARDAHPVPPLDGLLARIGDTPLVRLRRVAADLPDGVEVHAKLERFNPGGSVKDRAALSMVLDAERRGVLRPGMRILDASSGNTGIAYAMIAAARGYRLTLCLPADATEERRRTLRAYGAELVLTDPAGGADAAIARARELAEADPEGTAWLNQYDNDANWRAHLHGTGPEIWRDTAGDLACWVAVLGTSGTFTGVTRFLRSVAPGVRCVAVQPDRADHGLVGMKHMATARVPGIWDPALPDETVRVSTDEALAMTRRLAREEGILAGISSGAAACAALAVARRLAASGPPRGGRAVVVTLFPDGGDRYLSHEALHAPPRPR